VEVRPDPQVPSSAAHRGLSQVTASNFLVIWPIFSRVIMARSSRQFPVYLRFSPRRAFIEQAGGDAAGVRGRRSPLLREPETKGGNQCGRKLSDFGGQR
jgi:hypothetical protein